MHIFNPFLFFLLVRTVQSLQLQVPNTIPQCAPLSISWSDGQQLQSSSTFNLTVLPFESVPFNITVPSSSSSSSGTGSFSTTLSIAAGSSFLLSIGSGPTGATSNVVTVTSSNDASCLTSYTASKFSFATQPVNCNPPSLNITYFSSNLSNVPALQGYVPSGAGPFPIASVDPHPMWFVTVDTETQILLQFAGSNGSFGTSRLLTVGGSLSSNKCFSALFFSAAKTAGNAGPVQDDPSSRNKSAKLLGIIIGSVLGLAATLWGCYLWRERSRARIRIDRGIHGEKDNRSRDGNFGFRTTSFNFGTRTRPVPPRQRSSGSQFIQDVAAPSSKLFPYGSSFVSSESRRPAGPSTGIAATGWEEVSQPRARTPAGGADETTFDAAVSYNPSLLPQVGDANDSSQSLVRSQTRESGRVV